MAQGQDDAYLESVMKERDDILHQLEVLDRQIEELCARDDFEKAEQLDTEVQTLRHRLELVLAVAPDLGIESVSDDDDGDDDDSKSHDGKSPSELLDLKAMGFAADHVPSPKPRRTSVKLKPGLTRNSGRGTGVLGASTSSVLAKSALANSRIGSMDLSKSGAGNRNSGQWQEIPLTPIPAPHRPKGRAGPPSISPTPPRLSVEGRTSNGGESDDDDDVGAASLALKEPEILDVVLSFLSPEDLGRLCRVNRLWRERIEQDELWQPLFRSEWQYELNPSPGTYKRWYGAMRGAALSWMNPIVQQECVKHESFAGRVEVRSSGTDAFLIAMGSDSCTVWRYASLNLLHEIRCSCAYALPGDLDGKAGSMRLIGGDKKNGSWYVWDLMTGERVFTCAADEGAFMGGWYIVYRNYLVIYRRAQQTMRGYLWNYEARAADIVPPMLIWEVVGNFAMPKATKFGLVLTDFLRGLVRASFDEGQITVLLKERAEDLDPRNPRVRFSVDRAGFVITRRSSAQSAPILVYRHGPSGLSVLKSVPVPSDSKFSCISEDNTICLGVVENEEGCVSAAKFWKADTNDRIARPFPLPLDLASSRSKLLDAAICNDIIAGLFGDMLSPSELILWHAKTGKELIKLSAEQGQRPYMILRFTGLTATLVHKDGAVTKLRVVGRRAVANNNGGACQIQ